MVKRNSGSFTLAYDPENRLTTVSGGASATFVYDGDGQRVKATVNGTTTVYVGNYYEQAGSTIRKYYYHGGKRVAMRVGESTWYFLLTDHLTSTAITATDAGSKSAELRYKSWGETRYTDGTTPTTYRFTGQREEATIGLYFYNARWYDPALRRLAQPDTIVPDPGTPQDLNRYSYVRNSPLRYTDPTGYCIPGVNCPGNRYQDEPQIPPQTQPSVGPMCLVTPPPTLPAPSISTLLTPVPTPGPYITTLYGHDASQGQGRSWGPIPFSTGIKPFTAATVIPVDRRWLVPIVVPYRSGMEGSITYYENGAYIVVSDQYDASYLSVAGLDDLSLSRSIRIQTTSGEQLGPYSLGAVPPGQVGDTAADPITVWIRKEQGAPERIRMDLAVQGMGAKGAAIAWASYYIAVPLPYGPWPNPAPWFVSARSGP